MTKTFRPFFSPPDAEAGDDELLDELPDEEHAASTEAAIRSTAGANSARFRDRLILNPFNPSGHYRNGSAGIRRTQRGDAPGLVWWPARERHSWPAPITDGARRPLARSSSRHRAATDPAVGTKTLMSRSPPVT